MTSALLPPAVAASDNIEQGVSDSDQPKPTKFYEECDPSSPKEYYPLTLGTKLKGINVAEYVVLRKIGWGSDSTVWMARGSNGALVAIKVLTHSSSVGIYAHSRQELYVLGLFKPRHAADAHCCPPLDLFRVESDHGDHVCFVFPLHSICVHDLWDSLYSLGYHLPFRLVKSLVRQTLIGLRYLHSLNIVHTDVKTSNLLICMDPEHQSVADYLKKDPPAMYPPINDLSLSPDPIITFVSQPIPPVLLEMNTLRICLADFGEARPIEAAGGVDAMPLALRAPEVILDHAWGTPVDVWAVGCLAFELLTNTCIFNIDTPAGLSQTQVHLARITELLGPFPPALHTGGLSGEFFDDAGQLRTPLPADFRSRGTLSDRLAPCYWLGDEGDEVAQTAAFIRRCMSTDPQLRASVAELLEDEWLQDAYVPVEHCHFQTAHPRPE